MKKVMALILLCIILSGCGGTKDTQDKLLRMRQDLSGRGHTLTANIHADFGENTYDFVLDCVFDTTGNMTFSVKYPETISGISGKITEQGGALTFDDKSVAFCLLADGDISPVAGPWLVMKGLRGGFLASWREEGGGTVVTIDDTFQGVAVSFQILVTEDLTPAHAEVIWEGRSILTIAVENFCYL